MEGERGEGWRESEERGGGRVRRARIGVEGERGEGWRERGKIRGGVKTQRRMTIC